jgi:hypothetical protein
MDIPAITFNAKKITSILKEIPGICLKKGILYKARQNNKKYRIVSRISIPLFSGKDRFISIYFDNCT